MMPQAVRRKGVLRDPDASSDSYSQVDPELAPRAAALVEYFAQPDTPAPGSPLGVLITKLVDRFPGLTFEQARIKAHGMLDRSASRRIYRVPAVLSQEQEQEQRQRVVRLRSRRLQTAPLDAHSSHSERRV